MTQPQAGVGRVVVPTDTAEWFARQGLTPPPTGGDPRVVLADRLRRAWVGAGRPPMSAIGDEVGYSKASISKVLSGKMAPSYRLVRKLGAVLGAPAETVEEWLRLWVAADAYWHPPAGTRQRIGAPVCPRCGCLIGNLPDHDAWHATMNHSSPPAAERGTGPHQWANLRDALSRRDQ